METTTWILIAAIAVAVLLVAAGAWWGMVRRQRRHARTRALRERFGPEYDTVVDERGRKRGEAELQSRIAAHESLDVHRPPPDLRDEATTRWKEIQYRFLEDPAYCVREAEQLVVGLMRERGYPVDDLDARLRTLSAELPEATPEYRAAYEVYRASEDAEAGVAERFDAMVRYRKVFEALLERPQRESSVEGSEPPEHVPG